MYDGWMMRYSNIIGLIISSWVTNFDQNIFLIIVVSSETISSKISNSHGDNIYCIVLARFNWLSESSKHGCICTRLLALIARSEDNAQDLLIELVYQI